MKEQFISGKSDDDMITEIIRELTAIRKDQWNPQWVSVMLSQKGWGEKSPESNIRCDKRKQWVRHYKKHEQQN